jgi:hypothetical protein
VLSAALLISGCSLFESKLDQGPAQGVAATGTYPSLGMPLQAATTQMSDADAAAMGAQLQSLAAARNSGAVSEAEYQRRLVELNKLAKSTEPAAQPTN